MTSEEPKTEIIPVSSEKVEAIIPKGFPWKPRRLGADLIYVLRTFYGGMSQVTPLAGRYKVGKTDFSLFIAESCLQLGLVSRIATNIMTDSKIFTFIDNLPDFKQWLFHQDRKARKLMILDEAGSSLPSTRAVSTLNVRFKGIIEELSKGRCSLILIGHDVARIDKSVLSLIFVRGAIWKQSLKEAVFFASELGRPYEFYDVPRCYSRFDPLESATFSVDRLHPSSLTDVDSLIVRGLAGADGFKIHNIKRPNPESHKLEVYSQVLNAEGTVVLEVNPAEIFKVKQRVFKQYLNG
jgi:hypothetical protein